MLLSIQSNLEKVTTHFMDENVSRIKFSQSPDPQFFKYFLLFYFAGAKAEGATGFFKGVGKGLIGVVARPTGGLVDMASSTFEGLKR